jgi:hypothetical protein
MLFAIDLCFAAALAPGRQPKGAKRVLVAALIARRIAKIPDDEQGSYFVKFTVNDCVELSLKK